MNSRVKQAQTLLSQKKINPAKVINILKPLIQKKNTPWQAYHLSGIGHFFKKEYPKALQFFNKVIESGNANADTFLYTGLCYKAASDYTNGITFLKQAADSNKDHYAVWLNLGNLYKETGKLNEALQCYGQCNRINPAKAEVAMRIAGVYRDQAFLDKALEMYDIVLQMEPENVTALNEKAKLYIVRQALEQALEVIETALEIEPQEPGLLATKAEILKESGKFLEALNIYEEMLVKHPKYGGARSNYANILQDLGRFEEAEKNYLRANQDTPSIQETFSNYLFVQHYNPNKTKEETLLALKQWDSIYAPVNPKRPIPENKAKDKKLRIGLVSGGFRIHPVGWMIVAGLENLNQKQFDLYFYSNHTQVDEVTKRLHKTASEWRMISGFSDFKVEEMIREDEIDILVELSGHAAESRLRAVAMEPAPVIVKWVGGLINTTGLKAIDYLLTDKIETPDGVDKDYVEKLIRMPDDYICFTAPDYAPEVQDSPFKKNGFITFGCFNNPIKVNPVLLEKWAELMQKIPESRLFLKSKQYGNAFYTRRIEELMKGFGIAKDRLIFEGVSPHHELLEAYNRVDIALDPWPYSGGLTTCEALWMGLPVITHPGPTFAGRHAASHVHNAGFPEWIAENWDDYISKVVKLAEDKEKLAELRATLRDKVAASPLCDGKRFGAALGEAFRQMWIAYAEGRLKENAIDVEIPESDLTDTNLKEKKVNELEGAADGVVAEPEKGLSKKEAEQMDEIEMQESFLDSDDITTEYKGDLQDKQTETTAEKGIHSRLEAESSETKDSSPPANPDEEIEKIARFLWERGGKDNILVHGKHGVKYSVPESPEVMSTYVLLEQGVWYDGEVRFLYEYLRPGMNIVDVGAGFGAYALGAAKNVGASGKVYAFEPVEIMRKHLDISKVENGLSNLEVSDRALGAESGKMGLSWNSTPELTVLEKGGKDVQVVTMDKWWDFEGNPQLDVLKIDVNGRELDVLKGAEQVLNENSAVLILAITEAGTAMKAMMDYLNSKDFVYYNFIVGVGQLSPIEDWNQRDAYTQNIVAVKKDWVSELMESGWIYNEHIEVAEPEVGYWEKTLKPLPWTDSLFAEWKKNALKPEHKNYYRALDYICTAEEISLLDDEIDSSNTQKNSGIKSKPNSEVKEGPDSEIIFLRKNRSKKTKLLLIAAQELISKYNEGDGGVSVASTLIRVLNTLGKREQAVGIMQKLMQDTKMGQENICVSLPFLLPLPLMDYAPIRTEFEKWLMVRFIESWLNYKYVTSYTCLPNDKKLHNILKENIESVLLKSNQFNGKVNKHNNAGKDRLNLPSQVVNVKVNNFDILIPKNEIFRLKSIFIDNEYSLPEGFLVDDNSVILDVGGNIGAFSIYAYSWNKNAKIIAFEPNPQVYPLLQANTKNYHNISLYNFGLGKEDCVVELYQNPYNTGASSTSNKIEGAKVVKVNIKNAIDQISKLGIKQINVLKIDTEGSEVDILTNIKPMLNKVDVIMLEYHSISDKRKIISILKDFEIYASEKTLNSEVGTIKLINKYCL